MKQTLFLFLVLSMTCAPEKTPVSSDETPPNILFLFTDDQTYTAIRALGNKEIYTPNLDRLVNNGTSFTHAYNMGGWNGAICTASRAMIISGRSLWRANEFRQKWSDKDSMALEMTWARLMERQGYDTYMSGKWHVAAPADKIFQKAKHIRPGMPGDAWIRPGYSKTLNKVKKALADGSDLNEAMPPGYHRPMDEKDNSWSPTDTTFGGFWKGGKHWSEVLKDDALEFIQEAEKKENPFFMYLAFNAPHDPRQAPQSYIDKYPLDKISVPKNWLPEYPDKDSIGCFAGLRDEALAPFPRTAYSIQKHIQEYYAIISHLDTQVGEILDALTTSGKMENTYIFFTADHGLSVGRHGLIGKQNMYDHSMRVPLVVCGPDIPKGKKVEADVYLQDIMASSLDLAKIKKPNYLEFNSLLDLAKGSQSKSHYESIYGAYMNLQRMVRKDGFKLIYYPKVDKTLLFDLKKDPEEMNNLADDPSYKSKKEMLFEELRKLQIQMDDPLKL